MNYNLMRGFKQKNRRKRHLGKEEHSFANWNRFIVNKIGLLHKANTTARLHGFTSKKRRNRQIETICLKRARDITDYELFMENEQHTFNEDVT